MNVEIILSLSLLCLSLLGLLLAHHDWRLSKRRFLLLSTLAFLLLVPVGLLDAALAILGIPIGDRIIYELTILAFCFFVFVTQHVGLTTSDVDESD